MEKLVEDLKKSRGNLSDGSIKTYKSVIGSLYKGLGGTEYPNKEYFCKNTKKALEYISELSNSKRKTTLSALVVLCHGDKAKDLYRESLMEESDKAREENKDNQNEMSDKQRENWIDWKDVLTLHTQMGKEVSPLFVKNKLSNTDFNKMQDYIILSLYVLQDPRRSLDYSCMKIKNIDKKGNKENYIDGKNFIFNTYKTSNLYGQQKIPINSKLKTLLNKWIKILNDFESDTGQNIEYLLISPQTKKCLNVVQLNQRLNKIFGKRVGSSMLRHSYLTSLYDVEKMNKIASNMAHSTQVALSTYAKKKSD